MAKTYRVGLIGYKFMGRAHSNAWRQAPKFFNLKANIELHTICGRDAAGVQAARAQLGWQFAATDWREVVELRHLHGQSVPEIAAATSRTTPSVAGLLRRGLSRLRKLMNETDGQCRNDEPSPRASRP